MTAPGESRLTAEALERWALFGAHWQLLEISDKRAVIELSECTGAPVERLVISDPKLIVWLRGRGAGQ